jgi:four helix bundle protein
MPIIDDEEFLAWEALAPSSQRGDPVWRFHAHRVALFLLERASHDAETLQRRHLKPFQTDQLLRSVASISANVSEGLGRQSAADRSKFFGYALGSLRESQTWYQAVSAELAPGVFEERMEQLTELRKILIGAQKWLSSKPPGTHLM